MRRPWGSPATPGCSSTSTPSPRPSPPSSCSPWPSCWWPSWCTAPRPSCATHCATWASCTPAWCRRHDDTVQGLTAVGLRMDTLIRRMERGQAAESIAAAHEVRRMVGDATERTRRLSLNLYPPQLDHRGLGPALDALGNELCRDE